MILKNKMLTIGERLKQRRIDRGLTIEQVSDVIKIRKKYIEAIENSDYDVFASIVYIKGFLKNYAIFLGFDPNSAVALYRRECEEKKEKGLESAQKPINEPKFVLTPGKIIFAVFFIAIFGLFGYFYNQYQKFAAPPFLDIQSPRNGLETEQDSITIEGSTEIGSLVTINDQTISTDDLGNFKVTVSLRNGTNIIKVASENGIGKKSEEYVEVFLNTPTVAAASTDITDESGGELPIDNNNLTYDGIELEISIGPNSSWILIETDGEVVFSGVLVADSLKTFKANEKIYIKTGNAGSTDVKINGVKQDKLGGEGVVESREYTINSITNVSDLNKESERPDNSE